MQCCIVCSAHVDCTFLVSQKCAEIHNSCHLAICSFGDLRYDLIKPILESCSVENLVRLEHASPVRLTVIAIFVQC
jgi:hypothetical protein